MPSQSEPRGRGSLHAVAGLGAARGDGPSDSAAEPEAPVSRTPSQTEIKGRTPVALLRRASMAASRRVHRLGLPGPQAALRHDLAYRVASCCTASQCCLLCC